MKIVGDIYFYEWTSFFENNCNSFYIGGNVQALIDPGLTNFVPDLLGRMEEDGLDPSRIKYIINTHSHPDHYQGSELFSGKDGVQIGLHPAESEFMKKGGAELYSLFGLKSPQITVNLPLNEGGLELGGETFQVILAPGHSPGSVGLYWPKWRALFCGDVIFDRNVGRTDFPGGSGDLLKKSITDLSSLDTDFLLPGHMGIVKGSKAVKDNFKIVMESIFPYI
jgi:glyoxylase-like metal-dependent hydrolase (beta-lactamase superfamily II)